MKRREENRREEKRKITTSTLFIYINSHLYFYNLRVNMKNKGRG